MSALRVLGEKKTFTWVDCSDEAAIAEAHAEFQRNMNRAKAFAAYPENPREFSPVEEFDPKAETIIQVPQLRGG